KKLTIHGTSRVCCKAESCTAVEPKWECKTRGTSLLSRRLSRGYRHSPVRRRQIRRVKLQFKHQVVSSGNSSRWSSASQSTRGVKCGTNRRWSYNEIVVRPTNCSQCCKATKSAMSTVV